MNEKINFKTIIAFSVEVVLMRVGGPEYRFVLSRLEHDYNCNITDCYEKPEYLKKVLKDVYKDRFNYVISQIEGELMDWLEHKEIENFLSSLKEE